VDGNDAHGIMWQVQWLHVRMTERRFTYRIYQTNAYAVTAV